MCGIFGYISKQKKKSDVVLEGLKVLEYRGYDSWGIAAKLEDGKLKIEKHMGKIGTHTLNSQFSTLNSQLALGHTRWATHGGVTKKNAHPHTDCTKQIAIVHNGIVENFQELKKNLSKKGHVFTSETDTETIAHAIEEELKTKDFITAVHDAFIKLQGMNAIVVAYAPSNTIIATKTGSPLVLGKTEKTFYLASDATALLPYTKDLLFLEDNQFAVITTDTITLSSIKTNKRIPARFKHVFLEKRIIEKGRFPHFMLKEIHEQPAVLEQLIKNQTESITHLAKTITNARGTFFIGAGTASYAALAGTYFFSKIAKIHVNMAFASEFTYLLDFLTPKSLIIALSQSGETIDIVEPLNAVKKKKSTIVAVTNSPGSTISRMAKETLLLNAGPEQAVASTKAYTAKLAVLLLLAYAIKKDLKEGIRQVTNAVKEMKRLLGEEKQLKPIATLLAKSEHIYSIGRGVSYASALEGALKIKEVSYIHTEGLAGGELKHGTIALATKGTPYLVFCPQDETYAAIISNAIEIKSRGGVIIGIGPKQEPVFDHWIEVHDCKDATAIAQIIPVQILAYQIALRKGYDPDKPRNLAKSVTVK